MHRINLDIPVDVLDRSPELHDWLNADQKEHMDLRQQGYDRLRLEAEEWAPLCQLLETVTFREATHQILQEECRQYRQLLDQEAYLRFRQLAKSRLKKMAPQLRRMIRGDLEQLLTQRDTFNVDGYLRFSAKRIKALLRRLLEEEYDRLEQELEQEEFIALLQFFISIQQPLLDQAHLTIYGERFTLTDQWGNDLRQIYMESLLEEELASITENDLILSILITLLPRTIYLEVRERPASNEFLRLLEQVFGTQLVWQSASPD